MTDSSRTADRVSVQPEEITVDDSGRVVIQNEQLTSAVKEAEAQRSGVTIPTDVNITVCIRGDRV